MSPLPCNFVVRPPSLIHAHAETVPFIFRVAVPKSTQDKYTVTAQLVETNGHQQYTQEINGTPFEPIVFSNTYNIDPGGVVWRYFKFRGGRVRYPGTWKWRMRVYRWLESSWELVAGKDSKRFTVKFMNRLPNETIPLTEQERNLLREERIDTRDCLTVASYRLLQDKRASQKWKRGGRFGAGYEGDASSCDDASRWEVEKPGTDDIDEEDALAGWAEPCSSPSGELSDEYE
ncbi:hypothetical protein QBC35DRAFT_147392 [Podospora australis]|uniref:Uncharacterized protein n=1 Tax=Podospora australis TaxID=1536484 RepID=A0AAN6WJA6_9PEZI|nr:hypothetical protein QBC35DRAFT_147392 [Podospora australis]